MSSRTKKNHTDSLILPIRLNNISSVKGKIAKFSYPIHPFLFAIYPILFFYQHNIREVFPDVILKPVFWSLLLASILFFSLKFIFKNPYKSGVLSSLLIGIFFAHGHLHNLIGEQKYSFFRLSIGTDKILFFLWLIVVSFLLYAMIKNLIKNYIPYTRLLNSISILLVLFSLVNIGIYEIDSKRLFKTTNNNTVTENTESKKIEQRPDIYYIILDRYGSNSTYKEFYNFDNSGFTDDLKEMGFYVADKTLANYPRTLQSLASSLNLKYLTLGDSSLELVRDHKVGRFLQEQGYQYLHIGSWAGSTATNPIADENYKSDQRFESYLDLDEFSLKLVQTTILVPVLHQIFPQEAMLNFSFQHKNRALVQFKHLKDIAKYKKSPKFVFAHILLPHDPYVFDKNCGKPELSDSEIDNFLEQLQCTNRLVKETVNFILEKSTKPPIIIIQGDEGPMSDHGGENKNNIKFPFKEGQSYQDADIKSILERAQILNTIYLPETNLRNLFYRKISPVNTFRLIFNHYFGTKYKPLPDKTFIFQDKGFLYSIEKKPIKYIDITERIKD